MDECFRSPDGQRRFLSWGVPIFLLIMGIVVGLFAREEKDPLKTAGFLVFLSIILFFCSLGLYALLDAWRSKLTIQGERIITQGVFQRREFDLNDVTEARWSRGCLMLRTGSTRVWIWLYGYEAGVLPRVALYVHERLPHDIQIGWNIFCYLHASSFMAEYSPGIPRKPGPDEILLPSRRRLDILLGVSSVVVAIVTIAESWMTGRPIFIMSLFLPSAWAFLRFQTPAEDIVSKRALVTHPSTLRFLLAGLCLLLACGAGLIAHHVFGERFTHPNIALAVWLILCWGIFLYEAKGLDRESKRRFQEEADLAAKARGERRTDTWELE